jgi:transposase
MEKQPPDYLQQIPPEDWEKTPASVKKLVEGMGQGIGKLEQQVAELVAVQEQLLEKVNRTSKNSSSPPEE